MLRKKTSLEVREDIKRSRRRGSLGLAEACPECGSTAVEKLPAVTLRRCRVCGHVDRLARFVTKDSPRALATVPGDRPTGSRRRGDPVEDVVSFMKRHGGE